MNEETRRRTGEPCRCPEWVLRCECGYYAEQLNEFMETSRDTWEDVR